MPSKLSKSRFVRDRGILPEMTAKFKQGAGHGDSALLQWRIHLLLVFLRQPLPPDGIPAKGQIRATTRGHWIARPIPCWYSRWEGASIAYVGPRSTAGCACSGESCTRIPNSSNGRAGRGLERACEGSAWIRAHDPPSHLFPHPVPLLGRSDARVGPCRGQPPAGKERSHGLIDDLAGLRLADVV